MTHNKKLTTKFIEWYNNQFKKTELYSKMEATVEGSPYHRESNVAVHTDMVLENLLSVLNQSYVDQEYMILGLFAAIFHDTGKPETRVEKNSPERGTYYSFSQHELRSARLWESFWLDNKQFLLDIFGIGPLQAYIIGVMIEWHRPWAIKDTKKLANIFQSMTSDSALYVYFKLLWADNAGRISDDPAHLLKVETKIARYEAIGREEVRFPKIVSAKELVMGDRPDFGSVSQLIVPVGVSGAGKSTLFANASALLETDEYVQHSMDALRLELYSSDYEEAFDLSTKDNEFNRKVMADFVSKVNSGKDVFVDNTNLSQKRRRVYLVEATRKGYFTTGVLFRISLEELLRRNGTRVDKKIPRSAVYRQHQGVSYPLMGEFDRIILV